MDETNIGVAPTVELIGLWKKVAPESLLFLLCSLRVLSSFFWGGAVDKVSLYVPGCSGTL